MDRVKETDHVAWNTAVSIVTTGHTDVSTITGGAQTITGGPVASQPGMGYRRRPTDDA
jgi:replicative DNA helicase